MGLDRLDHLGGPVLEMQGNRAGIANLVEAIERLQEGAPFELREEEDEIHLVPWLRRLRQPQ